MAKKTKSRKAFFSVCGECAQPIDLETLQKAMSENAEYRHACGRVLVKGRGNAEVPTSDTRHSNASDSSPSD